MASDDEVIEAVLHGDIDRYAELVTRYQAAAWRMAYSFVGNLEDAKELSQNGFVKAYQHLGQFRGRSKFSTWLYRIVANECKDFFKRKARQPAVVSLDPDPERDDPVLFDLADDAGGPRDVLANRELATELGMAIQQLYGNQRAAFILHHLNGLSLEETAHIMGCRVGTVKAHLFRACEKLRIHLTPYVTMERQGRP